jgi:L-lactate dehydrogenase complex protein LldG
MEDITTSREKILKKVRAGLLNKFAAHFPDVEMETDIYSYPDEDHGVAFAKNFTASGGGFVYCHNRFDFHENLIMWMEKRGIKGLLVSDVDLRKEIQNLGLPVMESMTDHPEQTASLLSAEALTARNGGIMFTSANTRREYLAEVQVVAVYGQLSKLGDDMKQALLTLKNRYGEKLPSLISFAQGPIKGTKETKAQARSELVLFLVNDLA